MNFKKKTKVIIFTISVLFTQIINAQNIVINEVMSSNSQTVSDEDGDFPDWIELYNKGSEKINLSNYGLSDTSSLPFRWVFPEVIIEPNEYLLIFASGKDRRTTNFFRETIIDKGDEWQYFVGTQQPPANWEQPDFDDTEWQTGISGFGYGDYDDATTVQTVMSVFVRKEFSIPDTSEIIEAMFHIDYDDAFVAYLNGTAIAWENIEFNGTPPPFDQAAINYTEPLMAKGNPPASYQLNNWRDLLKNGKNVLAIQLHNHSLSSSDLTLIPFLTLALKNKPENARGISEHLDLKNPQLHTNFKIDADGEQIILTKPDNNTEHEIRPPFLPSDISYGAQTNGSNNYFYFSAPTPGISNTTDAFSAIAGNVFFSHKGGKYSYPVTLSLNAENSQDEIRYTTNGNKPTVFSKLYEGNIEITGTTPIRARAFGPDKIPGKVFTNTYFLNNSKTLPLISLVTSPDNLFDYNTGIYELGPDYDSEFPFFGANFWEDWERAGNVEIYDKQGNEILNANTGIKIFGGWSRGQEQKSFAFFARKQYGDANFDAKLFEDKPIDKFESFVLRNSGNDWMHSMFRDGFMTSLVKNLNIDRQAFRQSVLYINGEYWGIQNLREKVNEHFIEENFKTVDGDSIDMLENNALPIHGDAEHYNNLLDLLSQANFDYNQVKSMIDIANFTDYQLSQVYFDNTDWPGNNIKFWRPKSKNGKWRWILYDTDFGFGIWNEYAYNNNTLSFALATNGPDWPNPPWSTFLLRRMVTNEEFKNYFINRFADVLNTTFAVSNVVEQVNNYAGNINTEVLPAYNRWSRNTEDWQYEVNKMRNFATYRTSQVQNFIQAQFSLPGKAQVTLDVYPENSGRIKMNTIYPPHYSWTGIYFKDVPVEIIAKAPEGYNFVGWSGYSDSDKDTLRVNLTGNISLTAHFESDTTQMNPIIINEINYNSGEIAKTGDWIELYNTTEENIDISNWVFKDSDNTHSFIIPDGTAIPKDATYILCRDTFAFAENYPNVTNRIGNFDFGLSNAGELIRLYNSNGHLVDSVPYGVSSPWPYLANGNGPTLELKKPWLDNSFGQNWHSPTPVGTPGRKNNSETAIHENQVSAKTQVKVYPNPFAERIVFEFNSEKTQNIKILVYNTKGEIIKILTNNNYPPGFYTETWRLLPNEKENMTSGVYFYKIITESKSITGKLTKI